MARGKRSEEDRYERAPPVNFDPRCMQEALRMFFHPIKNEDPKLDFYTMYKRETTEYDTEYMQGYNEDLNTTLVFAGLFSAVSSAFVIDAQSKLQPDSSERSEAYLRAILLSLNRSIAPDEDPTVPPVWSGPPREIITTLDLLYASLLMSLLAAFVGMLGKQWLNRYLRHTGGSMVDRCGDRQRKFDGLEKWPFHIFIGSLPVMLQIALLLLASGLSRHMWSIDTSIARLIISFTALGLLFYIGIVVAGTSSYECPFQTPASIALRRLRDSETTRKLLASLSPSNVIYTARRNARKLLVILFFPSAASIVYATWMDAHQRLISVSHYDIRSLLSWKISLSGILSGIHRTGRRVGHQAARINRILGDAKHTVAQMIHRGVGHATVLPTTAGGTHGQLPIPHGDPMLRVRVWNLETIRRQNADNARCVCWILRNMTDPEAIDSAICLAGIIRWFVGESDHNPPFDFIVSAFETCFNSNKQLYPGMKNRAYFSARALLQIHINARAQSRACAEKYPLPTVSPSSIQYTDPDLHHIVRLLERNSGNKGPTLDFPMEGENSHNHLLWTSNFFVDVTHVDPNPTLKSYWSYLSTAIVDQKVMIANTLLIWCMFLGGHVEEETLWAVDKSDSLDRILSCLSTRVMSTIADGNCLQCLDYLLAFLAAWEKKPTYLTQMVSQWYSAMVRRLGPSERSGWQQFQLQLQLQLLPQLQLQSDNLPFDDIQDCFSPTSEEGFSGVGPGCSLVHLDDTSYPTHGNPQTSTPGAHTDLLLKSLDLGFPPAQPGGNQSAPYLNNTLHWKWMFETAFSSDNDEIIADAVCAWMGDGHTVPGLCAHYFTKRIRRGTYFSPRLQQATRYVIQLNWHRELKEALSETVQLLNHLSVDVDDVEKKGEWVQLLVEVIRTPMGFGSLSSHYWHLLGKLPFPKKVEFHSISTEDVKVVELLEKAEDWEKLEIWMVVIWQILPDSRYGRAPDCMEDIKQATIKLLLQRPSALQRLDNLCGTWGVDSRNKDILQGICNDAQAKPSTS